MTATRTSKPVVSEMVDKDILRINGVEYVVERLVLPAARCCRQCVRLHKGEVFTPSHKTMDVAILDNGRTECDCEDFIYRAGPEGRECKHITACRAAGLLADEPTAEAEFFEQDADAEWQLQMEMEHLRYDTEYLDSDLLSGIE